MMGNDEKRPTPRTGEVTEDQVAFLLMTSAARAHDLMISGTWASARLEIGKVGRVRRFWFVREDEVRAWAAAKFRAVADDPIPKMGPPPAPSGRPRGVEVGAGHCVHCGILIHTPAQRREMARRMAHNLRDERKDVLYYLNILRAAEMEPSPQNPNVCQFCTQHPQKPSKFCGTLEHPAKSQHAMEAIA